MENKTENSEFMIETFVLAYRDKHGRAQEVFFPRVPDNAQGVVSYPYPWEKRTTFTHEGEGLTLIDAIDVTREMLGY